MRQLSDFNSWFWSVALCDVFLLLGIWQVPGTIGIRYSLLALLLPVSLALCFSHRSKRTLPLGLPAPLLWLALLTGWIALVIVLWGAEPSLSWKEFRGQWLAALGVGLVGTLLTKAALAESAQRAMKLIAVIFWALLIQVLLHDVLDFAYVVTVGEMPFRQAPVFYLPEIARVLSEGRPLAEGFTEQSGDKFSYVNNTLAALVVAELLQRVLLKKRWLPIGWPVLILSLGVVLACTYLLQFRNGNVGLLFLIGCATFMGLVQKARHWSFWKVALSSALIVALLASFGVGLYKSDARWQTLAETVSIAWDTKTHQAWRRVAPYPDLPNGQQVSESNYERIAWAKEGMVLIREHPLGTGYNRNAYGDGIDRKYEMHGDYRGGHSHSGLVDFGIANGIPGLLLWLVLLGPLFPAGWVAFMRGQIGPALTLMFIVSGFFSRSIVDSNLRDHMLQQFMFLASVFYVMAAQHQAQLEGRK